MSLVRLGIRVRAECADEALAALLPLLVGVARAPVGSGWERRWHEFLRPVRVGPLVVRPPWIDGSPDEVRRRAEGEWAAVALA